MLLIVTMSVHFTCGCSCRVQWTLPSFLRKQDVCLRLFIQNSISHRSPNLVYLYFSHHLFSVNNLMPFPFVLIKVLGWSIFSILLPVVVLRIARIYEGEIHFLSIPERIAETQNTNDLKFDNILLGSLSPRNKLFE